MSASHALLKNSASQLAPAEMVLTEEVCPTCDQPIPHDHYEEVKERIEARQREQSAEIAARLQEQHARDKAHALEEMRQAHDAKVAEARNEARQAAEAIAAEGLAAAHRTSKEAQAALQAKLDEARSAASGAEAMIERLRAEAVEKEKAIHAEAMSAAEAAMSARIAESERCRDETEAALNQRIESADSAKAAAEAAIASLQVTLSHERVDHALALENVKADWTARESEIRKQIEIAAQEAAQEKVRSLEIEVAKAEATATAAAQQVEKLQQAHEAQLHEQREALEKAKDDAVNAERSAAFEERLKLQTKFEELKRAYDKKTAEELGEGAEIDLYEALKAEFEGDRIERISKGQPGADILHTVMHNGKECGKIIYDSKNHKGWRDDFVTKLSSDQMAAKAEHAILSTSKFPAGVRHLHLQDGVILVGPARVVAVAQIVRQHLVQTHTLRLSNEQRTQKTAALSLYDFIRSERCAGFFTRIDTHTDDLLDLQVKEKKAHEGNWKKQGELIRSVQKVRAELTNEIDAIVGTAQMPEGTQ
jgi:hypothetical protein